jgi:hypothetical protein
LALLPAAKKYRNPHRLRPLLLLLRLRPPLLLLRLRPPPNPPLLLLPLRLLLPPIRPSLPKPPASNWELAQASRKAGRRAGFFIA